MTGHLLLPLLVLMAFGSYFQTITGFGLGMIVMGATSGLGLAPVAPVASLVSLVTLANSAVAMPGTWHHIDWRAVRAATLGILPSIFAGVLLLDMLSRATSGWLQLLLGGVIIYGGISFMLRPEPLAKRSCDRSFFLSGVFGGLLSGLFGVSGPPLIFQFYRQPMSLVQIRCVLLLVFTVTSATRTLFSLMQGQLTGDIWLQCLLAVPVVAMATALGRRYPPPFSSAAMRRLAFAVLIGIGSYLFLSALVSLW